MGCISNTREGGRRGKRRVRTGVSWGKMKERGHLENLGVDVRMIIRQTFKKMGCEGTNWIALAEDRGK